MSEGQFEKVRRSNRVFMRVRVLAQGKNQSGRKFREPCETIVVNKHGCLLHLQQDLDDGALVVLENPLTQEEQECRVVYMSDAGDRGNRVGVEFLSPSPHFWGVDFETAGHPEGPNPN